MKIILATLFIVAFFIGCSSSTPTPPKVIKTHNANTTKEFDLFYHVKKQDIDSTKKLLEDGVSPNIIKDGKALIGYAVFTKNKELVELLLKYGANPNQIIGTKTIPMSIVSKAASFESSEILNLLFKYGASSKVLDHYYTMVGAVIRNRDKNLKILLDNGFNPNAKNEKNKSILSVAINTAGTFAVTKLLIDSGAKVDAKALFASIGELENIKTTKLLLEKGVNPNYINKNGATPLFKAMFNGNIEAVKYLIDYGANVEQKVGGMTPFNYALDTNRKIAKILLDGGALKDDNYIKLALFYLDGEMLSFLLDNGFKIEDGLLGNSNYINFMIVNNRIDELKEYIQKNTPKLRLKQYTKKAKEYLVSLFDSMDKTKFDDKKKIWMAKEFQNQAYYKRAYDWAKSIEADSEDKHSILCSSGAFIAKTDMNSCRYLTDLYKNDASKVGILTWYHLLLKEYDKVLEIVPDAIKAGKNYTYSNAGHVYLLRGEIDKAYKVYKNYFTSLKRVDALKELRNDFDMLKVNYPENKKLFDKAYEYCKEIDAEVLNKVMKD